MTPKIMVVEDEPVLLETLAYNMIRQGYDVVTAADGHEAIGLARKERPSLLVLDVMLPGVDGFEVCRVLRQEMTIPILMLTARTEEVDKIVGLEVGADDYMTKPFSMRELQARIKALLRRDRMIREQVASENAPNANKLLVFDDLAIDESRREVLRGGVPLALKPKEYELLTFLAHQRGLLLSRHVILERVWGWEVESDSRTVDVYIRWLREKIEQDPSNPSRIVTVRGIGYRFEG